MAKQNNNKKKNTNNNSKSNDSFEKKTKENYIELEGKVLEVIPGGDFKVQIKDEHIIIAHVSGKMRMNLIRIYPGDTVLVEIPTCDLTRGRIIYRK